MWKNLDKNKDLSGVFEVKKEFFCDFFVLVWIFADSVLMLALCTTS